MILLSGLCCSDIKFASDAGKSCQREHHVQRTSGQAIHRGFRVLCNHFRTRNSRLPTGGACFFSVENKPDEFFRAADRPFYSHSMQANAFSLICVSPVRPRASESTDYLYSPCSTASVYHFFISVIKRLFCCGLRGLLPWNHYTAFIRSDLPRVNYDFQETLNKIIRKPTVF